MTGIDQRNQFDWVNGAGVLIWDVVFGVRVDWRSVTSTGWRAPAGAVAGRVTRQTPGGCGGPTSTRDGPSGVTGAV
ncbi:MAG: hypothetical protein AVDCRST_MAG34-3179 [uncultured Nocardioidaceae bacterium]|uniref:Uncharacterized protein n=1 Tax=uncultured Nocardioidaceae bacterium TaxID=253824 RepID=A0A6J4MVW1_9ACTN|nr:MAG: hypothetical protein AVDCRST_MAG34-3179 [uncultured Nocardioidaceae bacterium]